MFWSLYTPGYNAALGIHTEYEQGIHADASWDRFLQAIHNLDANAIVAHPNVGVDKDNPVTGGS